VVEPLEGKRRVTFADVVDNAISKSINPDKYN